jgi:hypothetical protein
MLCVSHIALIYLHGVFVLHLMVWENKTLALRNLMIIGCRRVYRLHSI